MAGSLSFKVPQIGFIAMKSLRDELPRCPIGEHRIRSELLMGPKRFRDGKRTGGGLFQMRRGGRGRSLCIYRLCLWRRYESEVFRLQRVIGEDIANDRLGFRR